jgi:hypothetical protein
MLPLAPNKAARVVSLRRPVTREAIVASEKRPVLLRNDDFSIDKDYPMFILLP